MDLQRAVEQVFAPEGRLAQSVSTFRPRAGQTQMASEVAATMQGGGMLVVEAGTGIGKTFAYLIPALLSGERVLVSTATKALQDQLFTRDIPGLQEVLGVPVRIALLKGRSSYVCLHRLGAAVESASSNDVATHALLTRMNRWAQGSRSGDIAEFTALEENSPVVERVTSTRENCLGSRCPQLQSCHVNLARREAMAADLVVVNHHLFFADLQVRESGVAELLPSVRCVVFDEAHQLNEIGVQFLGRQLCGGQLLSFGRELEKSSSKLVWGSTDWAALLDGLRDGVDAVKQQSTRAGVQSRTVWTGEMPTGMDPPHWLAAYSALQSAMEDIHRLLERLAESSHEIAALHARSAALLELVRIFGVPAPSGQVRWMEAGTSWRLVQSPLDVSEAMQARVFPAAGEATRKSWIFTSATLGNDDKLSWFVQSCGLQGARVLRIESPFDHANQAGIYVPAHFPQPQDAAHSAQVAALVADAATVLGGRTLVLTTTLRAMHAIGHALQIHFADDTMQVLVQGQQGKRDLLARFVDETIEVPAACILVGSASFWEGIDIPGDALQLVVIDKLPFPPPGDPLVEARVQDLKLQGGSGFKDYFLPQAVIALKQGVGRLLRRETDRGVLVICDARLASKSYGRGILAALPPMRRLTSDAQFHEALEALARSSGPTRPSTKDLA
ncbi:MAG: ATP-dependent DNA helicase [Rhodoferax sp.]|nr:ATP-dependent DNA helicase [Rhodoferax sp.]